MIDHIGHAAASLWKVKVCTVAMYLLHRKDLALEPEAFLTF